MLINYWRHRANSCTWLTQRYVYIYLDVTLRRSHWGQSEAKVMCIQIKRLVRSSQVRTGWGQKVHDIFQHLTSGSDEFELWLQKVQDALRQHANAVREPVVPQPVSVTGHKTNYKTAAIWKRIYTNPDLYAKYALYRPLLYYCLTYTTMDKNATSKRQLKGARTAAFGIMLHPTVHVRLQFMLLMAHVGLSMQAHLPSENGLIAHCNIHEWQIYIYRCWCSCKT